MAWKKVYKDRLKKLADHLINGKLGHKKFDFARLNSKGEAYNDLPPWDQEQENKCGFSGCAIGECPILFPRHWMFNGTYNVVRLRNDHCETGYDSWAKAAADAGKFFGLEQAEIYRLFVPRAEHEEYSSHKEFGICELSEKATAKAVGKNILKFIAWKEKQPT